MLEGRINTLLNFIKKKRFVILFILMTVVYSGAPRLLSVNNGLPYLYFWDEPISMTGALNGVKTNTIIPNGVELVYGGAIRYPLMVIDYIYYGYLKITDPRVHSRHDIKTFKEGAHFTTSHSGFFYWNRVFAVSIAVLGFIFTFLIGRIQGGYFSGLTAVLILGIVPAYFETSYLLNVDIPLSTWILGAAYFAIKFNHTRELKHLLYSFIMVGLAGATKYTGAVSFIIPFTSALLNRDLFLWVSIKGFLKSIFKWGGISFLVFMIFNPVVFTYPDRIYKMIKWIGKVYKTGQGHFVKQPGLEHLNYQLGQMKENLGDVLFYLALIGFALGLIMFFTKEFWKRKYKNDFLIFILFPVVYLLLVTFTYTVAYHRNFYLMYPFLSVLIAGLISAPIQGLKLIQLKPAWIAIIIQLITLTVLAYLIYPRYNKIMKQALHTHRSIDNRSKAVMEVNKIGEDQEVFLGIDNNLFVSPEDLEKLNVNYSYYNITDLPVAMKGFTHLLVADYDKNEQISNFDSLWKELLPIIQTEKLKELKGIKLYVPKVYRSYEYPIVNPSFFIVKGSSYPPPLMSQFKLLISSMAVIELPNSKPVLYYSENLKKGEYSLSFQARGDSANLEFPKVIIKMNDDTLTDFEPENEWKEYSTRFNVGKEGIYSFYFQMTNDYYDPERGMDRNAFLQYIELRKEPPGDSLKLKQAH